MGSEPWAVGSGVFTLPGGVRSHGSPDVASANSGSMVHGPQSTLSPVFTLERAFRQDEQDIPDWDSETCGRADMHQLGEDTFVHKSILSILLILSESPNCRI